MESNVFSYDKIAEDMFNSLSGEEPYTVKKEYQDVDKEALSQLMKMGFVDYDNDVDHDDNGQAISSTDYYWFNERGLAEIKSPADLYPYFEPDNTSSTNYEIPYMRGREDVQEEKLNEVLSRYKQLFKY
jgi:hypothetical protein